MTKIKKITIASILWNILIFLLLLFQTRMVYLIIKTNLFPTMRLLKPLIDGNIIAFLKTNIIITAIMIVLMILFEIIIFFMVNKFLYKLYIGYSKNESKIKLNKNMHGFAKTYKYNNIYFTCIIIFFIVLNLYGVFSLYGMYNQIDFSMNNKTVQSVYDIVMNVNIEEVQNLNDLTELVTKALEQIKNDSIIYQFVIKTSRFLEMNHYLNKLFFIFAYALLGFGIFKGLKVYISLLDKNERKIVIYVKSHDDKEHTDSKYIKLYSEEGKNEKIYINFE